MMSETERKKENGENNVVCIRIQPRTVVRRSSRGLLTSGVYGKGTTCTYDLLLYIAVL